MAENDTKVRAQLTKSATIFSFKTEKMQNCKKRPLDIFFLDLLKINIAQKLH